MLQGTCKVTIDIKAHTCVQSHEEMVSPKLASCPWRRHGHGILQGQSCPEVAEWPLTDILMMFVSFMVLKECMYVSS